MYEPEKNNAHYFLILIAIASLIGWAFFTFYRPIIIEAGCSDIAAGSSNIFSKGARKDDPYYKYDNIKVRCIEEIKYQ